MKGTHWLAIAAVTGFAILAVGCGAIEHPTGEEHPTAEEHPTEHPAGEPAEHPEAEGEDAEHPTEHPTSLAPVAPGGPQLAATQPAYAVLAAIAAHEEGSGTEAHAKRPPKPLTIEDVAVGIEEYVATDTKLKGGYFLIYDDVTESVMMLKLDKVHKERLAITDRKKRIAFVCADFAATDEKVYDLDFWMAQDDEGRMHVTQIMVHKEEGEPRYTWYEQGGVWKQRPVD